MLKIITPKGQKFHQPMIEAFLDLLKVYQNFDLSRERRKKATFIIAEDSTHGVYGGAVLYPQKIYDLEKDVFLDDYEDTFRGVFASFRPQIQEFWISKICFCLEANLSPDSLEELELYESFTQEIYEALSAFGQSKETEFLAFSLCSFDTIDPLFYKKWLYFPIWRSDDTSGLTHGILSLNGTRFIPKVSRKRSTTQETTSGGKPKFSCQERAR